MIEEIEYLIQKYSNKGILIDTNILLLFFVGAVRKSRISRFKRTRQFTALDYEQLIIFLQNFKTIVATPNVLTEVSSFINQLGEPDRSKCYVLFAEEIKVETVTESFIPSRSVVSTDWDFLKYGLTDCGIAAVAKDRYLVLTDDFNAVHYFYTKGVDTVNFNNIRTY